MRVGGKQDDVSQVGEREENKREMKERNIGNRGIWVYKSYS